MEVIKFSLLTLFFLLMLSGCGEDKKVEQKQRVMQVTATAYNSLPGQTLGHPSEAAWGDTLKPGMRVIAVSRDLIDSGLTYRKRVKIDGLPGTYVVIDKMNSRWKRKIDIYMGISINDALEWGRREVTIRWEPDEKEPQK